MKIQTKITALLLTLPLAYATGLTGTVAATTGSIVLSTAPTLDGTSYTSGVIDLTLNNNAVGGWKAEAQSANASKFINSTLGDLGDGYNFEYDISCSEIVADANFLEAIAAKPDVDLTIADTNYVISDKTSPTYPSTGSVSCTIDSLDDESVGELFAGTYTDTITISLSNL